MAKDKYGNYIPGMSPPTWHPIPAVGGECQCQILGESDIANDGNGYPVSNPDAGISVALWIANDGTNRQWFDGEWH